MLKISIRVVSVVLIAGSSFWFYAEGIRPQLCKILLLSTVWFLIFKILKFLRFEFNDLLGSNVYGYFQFSSKSWLCESFGYIHFGLHLFHIFRFTRYIIELVLSRNTCNTAKRAIELRHSSVTLGYILVRIFLPGRGGLYASINWNACF